MKQRPILFNTLMVQALLAGTKTQTRRIIKPQPDTSDGRPLEVWYGWPGLARSGTEYHNITPPYGRPDDILWVRETFLDADDYACSDYDPNDPESEPRYSYRADCPADQRSNYIWRPSLFMPREACRLFLRIKSIRTERLQEISEADALAEGYSYADLHRRHEEAAGMNLMKMPDDPQLWYAELWRELNGKESYNLNPWVWVIDFERIEKP